MADFKHMINCFFCKSPFQFGPHIYNGKHIPRYNITVCRNCYDSNWDGWVEHYAPSLIAHLHKCGIPIPDRNAAGYLPRD